MNKKDKYDKIYEKAGAITMEILSDKIKKSMVEDIKDQIKKAKVLELYNKLNLTNIKFSNKIIKRAQELRQYNIKNMDSLHIAYAESSNIDYFITTDRLLINAAIRVNLKVKVINPINLIMEVV